MYSTATGLISRIVITGCCDCYSSCSPRVAALSFSLKQQHRMSDTGVALVTGTDAPSIPGLVSGFSLHDDLAALEQRQP